MTDLSAQKRLASEVLDVGKGRVWFDPARQADIAEAITRADIRDLVDEGAIRVDPARGNSRGRARKRKQKRAYGHRTGPGTRKGKKGARQSPKADWQARIRAQRRRLRELRDDGDIDRSEYRQLYDMAGGGEFDDVADMERYLNESRGES